MATALLGVASLVVFVVRLTQPVAITPWESAIALEGMRVRAGLPLYETGHATHLYGPLLSVVLGGIFSLVEFNLLWARIVFSIFGLALVGLLTVMVCRGDAKRYWLLAAFLFLAVNLRTNFIFLTAQPDCLAAFLALLALAIWITRSRSWLWVALSLVLFLLALLVKQTSAAFALVPIAHAVIWRRTKWSVVIWSFLPAAFLLVSLVAIRLFLPALFEGIVLTPGRLTVHYDRSFAMTLFFLGTFPMLFIALTALFSQPRFGARERWLGAAAVVLVPVSIWTIIKSGGGYNSLLFGYLAMTALVVSQLDRIRHWIGAANGGRTFFRSGTVALAIVCSFFFQFDRSIAVLLGQSGDEKYDAAVQVARRVGAGMISPQDPTIAFRANGFFGRALYFELDAHSINGEWPPALPEGMQREVEESRYLMQVQTGVPSPLTPEYLARTGFHLLDIPALHDSAYALWARTD